MAKAQFSKATVKLRDNMSQNDDYQVQVWLQADNGWDEASRRRNPMSAEQQAIVDQIHQLCADNNINLQLTIKRRSGVDVTQFPATCYADLYVNQPQQNNQSGGSNGSSWTSLA